MVTIGQRRVGFTMALPDGLESGRVIELLHQWNKARHVAGIRREIGILGFSSFGFFLFALRRVRVLTFRSEGRAVQGKCQGDVLR